MFPAIGRPHYCKSVHHLPTLHADVTAEELLRDRLRHSLSGSRHLVDDLLRVQYIRAEITHKGRSIQWKELGGQVTKQKVHREFLIEQWVEEEECKSACAKVLARCCAFVGGFFFRFFLGGGCDSPASPGTLSLDLCTCHQTTRTILRRSFFVCS